MDNPQTPSKKRIRVGKKKKSYNHFAEDILVNTLKLYYAHHLDQYDTFRKLVAGAGADDLPSLRELEFIITNPFKYDLRDHIVPSDVRQWYKDILSDFKKHFFDSFRRTTRLEFSVKGREDQPISTTVAQLNWSREMFTSGLMQWASNPINRKIVQGDMYDFLQRQRLQRYEADSAAIDGVDEPPIKRRKRKDRRHDMHIQRGSNIVVRFHQ